MDEREMKTKRPTVIREITGFIVSMGIAQITAVCFVCFISFNMLFGASLTSCTTFPYCPTLGWIIFFIWWLVILIVGWVAGILQIMLAINFYALKGWTFEWVAFLAKFGRGYDSLYEELYTQDVLMAFGKIDSSITSNSITK